MSEVCVEVRIDEWKMALRLADCPDPEETLRNILKWDNVLTDRIDEYVADAKKRRQHEKMEAKR